MNDIDSTRMVLTTAVCAAVAALLAVPAQARFLDNEGGGATGTTESQAVPGSPVPDLSGVAAYAGRFGDGSSLRLTDSEQAGVDRAVAAANEAWETYRAKTATEAREALLGTSQHPSVGLAGDSAPTRGEMQSAAATQPVTSGDDLDWAWVGFGGGAALLAAAMSGFYLGTRHRGRIALP